MISASSSWAFYGGKWELGGICRLLFLTHMLCLCGSTGQEMYWDHLLATLCLINFFPIIFLKFVWWNLFQVKPWCFCVINSTPPPMIVGNLFVTIPLPGIMPCSPVLISWGLLFLLFLQGLACLWYFGILPTLHDFLVLEGIWYFLNSFSLTQSQIQSWQKMSFFF